MKRISWTCDVCGKEIKEDEPLLRIEAYGIDHKSEEPTDTFRILGEKEGGSPVELCESCVEDYFAVLFQDIRAAKAKKKEQEKKERKTEVKLPLDTGKIRVLYEAGWNPRQIAGELKVSDETIRNRLKELGIFKDKQKRAEELKEKEKKKTEERFARLELGSGLEQTDHEQGYYIGPINAGSGSAVYAE